MGLDLSSSPWHPSALPRGCRLALLTVAGLILLLIVPLYQLRDHDAAGYYYKKYVYENLHKYLGYDGVYNNTLYHHGKGETVHAQWNFSTPCDGFPNTDDIMLVMKTGATEAYDKLPTQLLTSLQCMPDFLLFSDLEQQIGKYHVYNVLENVDEKVKKGLMEFKLYNAQINCPVSQKDCTKDMKGGWELDKYKFLHMVELAWKMRPGREWYVFAEADTYVFWPNLMYWLRHKANANKAPYVGSVAYINNMGFAHGGSGYVIHGKTMKKMVETIKNLAAKYDARAPHECCGDLLMALAVKETGHDVKQLHPLFNGEKPNTLPYGHGHWCEPLLTMHHMNSEEVSSVWQYEQTRKKQAIVQIKDMYQAFFAPHLKAHRLDWDNLSEDTCYIGPEREDQDRAGGGERDRQKEEFSKNAIEKRAHMSAAACAKVCESAGLDFSDEEIAAFPNEAERDKFIRGKYDEKAGDTEWHKERRCFQWRYHNGACCTASSFKFGTPREESNKDERWLSGWFVDGINDWIDAVGECKPEWKDPQ